jgi:hypothetical protein
MLLTRSNLHVKVSSGTIREGTPQVTCSIILARPINWHAQFSFFGGLVDPRGSGENRRLRDDQWHPAPCSHAAGFIVPIKKSIKPDSSCAT